MRSESAEPLLNRNQRRAHRSETAGRRGLRPPSAAGYFAVSGCVAALLFFVVWSMSHETSGGAPWAAALAACVVLLIAASAREILVRRAWSRQLLEADGRIRPDSLSGRNPFYNAPATHAQTHSGATTRAGGWSHTNALRALQKHSVEADTQDQPEIHWEMCQLCQEYLSHTEEASRNPRLAAEKRVAMRSGQERARGWHKHHLKAWARTKSGKIAQAAQQRVCLHDKLETAQSVLPVLETALAQYPEDTDLQGSRLAIQEFMASARVAHWVEIAERAAFRGNYRRAIARYRDALFYVSREVANDASREELETNIQNEIRALRAKIAHAHALDEATPPQQPPSNPAQMV